MSGTELYPSDCRFYLLLSFLKMLLSFLKMLLMFLKILLTS
jgi:hypothetical protein